MKRDAFTLTPALFGERVIDSFSSRALSLHVQQRVRLALAIKRGTSNYLKAHALVKAHGLFVLFVDVHRGRIGTCKKRFSNPNTSGAGRNEQHLNLPVCSAQEPNDTANAILEDLQLHRSQVLLTNQGSQSRDFGGRQEVMSSPDRRLPHVGDLVEVIRGSNSNGAHWSAFSLGISATEFIAASAYKLSATAIY